MSDGSPRTNLLLNKTKLTTSHSYASCNSLGMETISFYAAECPIAITIASHSFSTAVKGMSLFFLLI